MKRSRRSSLLSVCAATCLVATHYFMLSQYFPDERGTLGGDYSYFLPQLLDGFFWYRANGLFAVPWFTPSFCAGVPKLANPQALYYSFPQLATVLTNPLTALKLTLISFGAIGFYGFFMLERRCFCTNRSTALLGGVLFLFNGLFASRMLVGHLTFHSFMLSPLLFFLLLRRVEFDSADSRWRFWFDVVCAALLIAYIAGTALPHLLFQTLLAALIVALLLVVVSPDSFGLRGFAAKFAFSGCIALGICAAKLVAILFFLKHFPRTLYPFPGVPSLGDLLVLLSRALFFDGSHWRPGEVVVNSEVSLGRHEFDFEIGMVPLCLLLAGAAVQCRRLLSREFWMRIRGEQWAALALLSLLLMLPLALNYYTPAWNHFLKALPIIRNSSTGTRWLSVYIPVLILTAVLVLERTPSLRRYQVAIAWFGIASALYLNFDAERLDPALRSYYPRQVVNSFEATKSGKWSPAISRVGISRDKNGREVMVFRGNTSLVRGTTQLLCYETLFGFDLEALPRGETKQGSVFPKDSRNVNIKNPSCYLYPDENSCKPGDHFTPDQRSEAKSFAAYGGFRFQMPLRQKAANALSLVSIFASLLFLGSYPLRQLLCRRPDRSHVQGLGMQDTVARLARLLKQPRQRE